MVSKNGRRVYYLQRTLDSLTERTYSMVNVVKDGRRLAFSRTGV